MEKSHLKPLLKFIFLPALLLTILLAASSTLFFVSKTALLGNQIAPDQIPPTIFSSIIPQILLVAYLLIFSLFKPFEKVVNGVLITLISVMIFLIIFLIFQKSLLITNAPDALGMYKPLLIYWPTTLMYYGLSLLSYHFFGLLIWGFINRLFSIKDGKKYYIPAALALAASGLIITNIVLMVTAKYQTFYTPFVITGIILMILSLFVFNGAWKRLPKEFIEPVTLSTPSQIRFPYISVAYLLAGTIMVNNLVRSLMRPYIKTQLPNPTDFAHFMSNYAFYIGLNTIIIGIIWALLGTWLIIKKGWKTTALYGAFSALFGSLLLIGFPFSPITQGIYAGLLASLSSMLFFPLIQMLYLHLPYQNRFSTKIITEMIGFPIFRGLSSVFVQVALIVLGSMAVAAIYLKIMIPILLLLLFVPCYRISSKFLRAKTKM